jgi:acetyl esterase/lipase
MNTPSYVENAQAKPLNKPMVEWFVGHALRPQDMQSPMINLVAADLRGLPPATVITAEIDPLRSEGMLLAERLRAAGVEVTARDYEGVTHEFFGMDAVVPEAKAAQNLAGRQLVAAFTAPRTQ